MLATQLAQLNISTRVVDKMAHPVLRGHADGLQCRTEEVFDALGLKAAFDAETHECAEVVIWDPTEDGIVESNRVVDTTPGLSRCRHVNLGQDRVEAIFLADMEKHGLTVDRLLTPTSMAVDEERLDDPAAYPVTVTLKRLPKPKEEANGDVQSGLYRSNLFVDESSTSTNDPEAGADETVHCKYLVGCDGARSWVRKSLGLELKGDSANVYWGAFDAVIDTDLPTSRMKHVIHSKHDGTVLMVPREDSMVRIYTQMGTLNPGERLDRSAVTLEKLCEKTQQVVKPYEIKFPYVDWWTCYEIGQRVCDTFSQYGDHVLIAGDACHTHSPKAGQGMNVSMMDTFNLGWKLASVLRGQARMELVHTYHEERQKTAKELIDFDRKFSAMFTGQAKPDELDLFSPEQMKGAWEKSIRFTSGTGVEYLPNSIVLPASEKQGKLARNVKVGSHLENQQVFGAFNAHDVQLQAAVRADGRWRVIVFPGDVRDSDRLAAYTKLGEDLTALSTKYTPKGEDSDAVIQTLTVFDSPHKDVQYMAAKLPAVYMPRRKPWGVRAFDTAFTDEDTYHNGPCAAYKGYGIDPNVGAVVVVRPDQYVSGVFGMDEGEKITQFFDRFMIQQQY